jgi:hypothetical protein
MNTPPQLVLDHVAIGCASLDAGAAYVCDLLGVEVPAGGRHERMGTHNRLMRLGGDVYLELIAIDPEGQSPARPRWFALDEAWQQARIAERPRPIAWLASTRDIAGDLAAAPELGAAVEMTRGDLVWQIALTADGVPPRRGLLPVLIEWPGGRSPVARIPDLGVTLVTLRLVTAAPALLRAALARIGAQNLVEIAPADGEERIELDVRRASGAVVTLR